MNNKKNLSDEDGVYCDGVIYYDSNLGPTISNSTTFWDSAIHCYR